MGLASLLFERVKAIGPEVGAEVSRLGGQGAIELASALFNGNAFTPYGPGQITPSVSSPTPQPEMEQHQDRGIER
jgi:hypothetical protein